MNKVLLAFCVLALAMFACGSSTAPQTADEYVKEFGGSKDVYEQILASTDCEWLQHQFDQAYANSEAFQAGTPQHIRATGFMKASDQRMKEIGCYK